MRCPRGCGEMMAGELLWVCGWCGTCWPRKPSPTPPLPQMVKIPAGKFKMGSSEDDPDALPHEKPQRTVYLSGYWISAHPITNGQYRSFVQAAKRDAPAHWKARLPVGENSLHPVCFVSWHDVMAYCGWLSQVTGHPFTLPTEAQWEKAARGGLWLDGDETASVANSMPGRRFPNGNQDLLPEHANLGGLEGGTTVIGNFPGGASPYGCLDMAGNVSEWCLDTYDPEFYKAMSLCDPCREEEGRKALRGGSWRSGMDHVRCSNRYYYPPGDRSYGIGFRVVRLR